MNKIDLPSTASPFMIFMSSSISCGVNTAVGSSNIRISLSLYSIFRISTLCCMPTVISSINASGSTNRLYFSLSMTTFLRASSIFSRPCSTVSIPSTMFCNTVKLCTSLKCWCTIPIPYLLASKGPEIFTSSPLILMTPFSGLYIPNSTLIKVDLPAPFSPRNACISPGLICNVISSFAMIPGNSFVI